MGHFESIIIVKEDTKEEEIDAIIRNVINLVDANSKLEITKGKVMEPVPNKKGRAIFFVLDTSLKIAVEIEESFKKNEKIIYELMLKY